MEAMLLRLQKVFDPPYVAKSEYKDVTTETYDPDTGNFFCHRPTIISFNRP